MRVDSGLAPKLEGLVSLAMAIVTTPPGLRGSNLVQGPSSLNTMRDFHSPGSSPTTSRSASSSPLPELDNEVTSLSNKLILAINHQTTLDDTLTATRQELEAARQRVSQLERQVDEHAKLLATGALVRRTEVEDESGRLVAKLAEEKQLRTVVEKDKKGIEQELENLTTALFEEANEVFDAPSPFTIFVLTSLSDGSCSKKRT